MTKKYWGPTNNLEVGMTQIEGMQQQSQPQLEPTQQSYPEVIEVVENRIYFYADIDRINVLRLNKTIDTLNNDLLHRAKITNHTPPDIYLYVNSFGGHVFDAFSALDTIITSPIPITTVVDGCAASAATFLTIAGEKRYIKNHSYILIHQLSSAMWGKYAELLDEMQNLDKFMTMIKKLYKEHTKLPMSKLDEILKHDIWFDAEQAVEFGLVDEILK